MAKLIDGREISEKIYAEIRKKLESNPDLKPGLAIVQIGDREDSKLYVKLKEKQAFKLGIDTHLYKFSEDSQEDEIIETIKFLNKDENIDAILVQLPLPEKFDTDKIIKAIDPKKDVDRFHPDNLKKLLITCNHGDVMPPLIEAVLEILSEINYEIKNKKAVIVANSEIFGKSLKKVLECLGAEAENISPKEKGLINKTEKADLLISAVGKPCFIAKDMIKEESAIIDIGISNQGKKVLGDVDFADVEEKAGFITPVPGGVGPLTIAMLLKNTLKLAKGNLG